MASVPLLQSTLMRAIANEQLDGFPPKSELRTVFVEHDIDASEAETAVVEYVFLDPVLQGEWSECDAVSPVFLALLPHMVSNLLLLHFLSNTNLQYKLNHVPICFCVNLVRNRAQPIISTACFQSGSCILFHHRNHV